MCKKRISMFFCLVLVFAYLSGCAWHRGSTYETILELDIFEGGNNSNIYQLAEITTSVDAFSEEPKDILTECLNEELSRNGLLEDSLGSGKYKINIDIILYRMRSAAARFWGGSMAGADRIDSIVTVRETASNKVIGKSKVSNYEVMWYKSPEQTIKTHAKEIVKFLMGMEPTE